jgi:hypothetical protein
MSETYATEHALKSFCQDEAFSFGGTADFAFTGLVHLLLSVELTIKNAATHKNSAAYLLIGDMSKDRAN